MTFVFCDERQKNVKFVLSAILISDKNVSEVNSKVEKFKIENNLAKDFELHKYSSSLKLKTNFKNLILELLNSKLIDQVISSKVIILTKFPNHYLQGIQDIFTLLNKEEIYTLTMDKLGGKRSEAILKTNIARIVRDKKLNFKKIKFEKSQKSNLLQIADFCTLDI